MTPVIIGFLIALPIIYGIDWFCADRPYIPKFLKGRSIKSLKATARRVRKIEEDGQAALKAIQNLHETKKRINKEYREKWDNEFRLLLPPPKTPNRSVVRWKGRYRGDEMTAFFSPSSGLYDEEVKFGRTITPVPVGAIKRMGEWWYGFNNLPGYPHQMMFQRIRFFHTIEDDKFWAFLPTIRETPEGYVWDDNKKVKTLASNLTYALKEYISG